MMFVNSGTTLSIKAIKVCHKKITKKRQIIYFLIFNINDINSFLKMSSCILGNLCDVHFSLFPDKSNQTINQLL